MSDATSLFTYGPGQSTADFTDRSFPSAVVSLADIAPDVRAAAEAIAVAAGLTPGTLAFDNAVLDVALTGDSEYAVAAAGSASSGPDPVRLIVDTAPVALPDLASLALAGTATGDVLANDSDPDVGDILRVTTVQAGSDTGQAVGATGSTVVTGLHGTLSIGADGRYSYQGTSAGVDGFTYTVSDGRGLDATAGLTLTVIDTNRAPTALGDMATMVQDTRLTLSAATLLGNDTDPDGDPLAITAVGGATQGVVSLDAVRNLVTYTPTVGYTGAASFNYTVADGRGGVASGVVSVTVQAGSTGIGMGDVHYTTLDGLRYDLQANGDFRIARTTAVSDFEIQGRSEDLGMPGLGFLTAIGVKTGGHSIVFDEATRDLMLVDGMAVVFAVGDFLDLGGGFGIARPSDLEHEITTPHEVVHILDHGLYLDLTLWVGSARAGGSFEGLLGDLDGYTGNDFALDDGTLLHRPSIAQIEGIFADAWRLVPGENLLADLGDEEVAQRIATGLVTDFGAVAVQDWQFG